MWESARFIFNIFHAWQVLFVTVGYPADLKQHCYRTLGFPYVEKRATWKEQAYSQYAGIKSTCANTRSSRIHSNQARNGKKEDALTGFNPMEKQAERKSCCCFCRVSCVLWRSAIMSFSRVSVWCAFAIVRQTGTTHIFSCWFLATYSNSRTLCHLSSFKNNRFPMGGTRHMFIKCTRWDSIEQSDTPRASKPFHLLFIFFFFFHLLLHRLVPLFVLRCESFLFSQPLDCIALFTFTSVSKRIRYSEHM